VVDVAPAVRGPAAGRRPVAACGRGREAACPVPASRGAVFLEPERRAG